VPLVGFLAATLIVGGVGAAITAPSIPGWYQHLQKPPLTPPGWLFGPVWTVLYVAMAVAAWLTLKAKASVQRSAGLLYWWFQLGLNLLWTVLFFGLHQPGVALGEFAMLIYAVVVTMQRFAEVRPVAMWLMVPYLAWCGFAFYLNAGIWYLNQ
jgi:tryptophan-rich sensory protein